MKIKLAVSAFAAAGMIVSVAATELPSNAAAEEFAKTNPGYYRLDPASITSEIVTPESVLPEGGLPDGDNVAPLPGGGHGGSIIGQLDQIVNIARTVFKIIEKNKPVVNVATSYACAVPKGVTHWTDLQNWKAPKSVIYEWSAKNLVHMKVVTLRYQMMFTYGGGLDGKGKFLTGVTVQPIHLDVAWGYTVNVKFEAPESTIVNVGSREDPIAAMTATMLFSVDNLLVHDEYREVFYMQGDGMFKKQS